MTIIEASASLKPARNTHLNPLAIVGFGPSKDGYKNLPPGVPIWTLNDAENYGIEHFDVAFEMHPIRDVITQGPRWDRLVQGTEYPVYMIDPSVMFPSALKYPLDWVREECFANIIVGNEHAAYLDSSLPYMLALAVLVGYNPIYLYGFELRSDTEFSYQRTGAALLIGWASGRGVTVILPQGNALLPRTLYGYEDYQMISRQNLEQFISELSFQESDWMGKLNVAHTKVVERRTAGAEPEAIEQAENSRNEAYRQMYMCQGAIQFLRYLVDICDRKEQAVMEFTDNFVVSEDSHD